MKINDTNRSREDDANNWIAQYLRNGDKQLLGKVYEMYKQRLYFHCLKIIINQEEAKDMTNDAFVNAFENIQSFNLQKPFYPWLSRIATNLCIDQLRKRRRYSYQVFDEDSSFSYSDGSAEGHEDQDELKDKIMRTIDQLKPTQRKCFSLFYIHQLSYQEIIGITGLPYNAVRSHIQNGRRKFKLLMEQSS